MIFLNKVYGSAYNRFKYFIFAIFRVIFLVIMYTNNFFLNKFFLK